MSAKIQKKYLLGEFELDTGLYSLSREGIPVALSRKRFQVLLYLVEERQRLVTRKELVERFWEGHEVYEENLTKCISEIRKALDDQHKPHRFIETLPAVGYRYIGPLEECVTQNGPPDAIHEGKILQVVPSRTRSRAWVAILAALFAAVVLVAAAIIVYPRRIDSRATDYPATIHSLAILPFKPIS